MKYKIDILKCHGCENCIFKEIKQLKRILRNGELYIEVEKILKKNCDAVNYFGNEHSDK